MVSLHDNDYWAFTAAFDFSDELEEYLSNIFDSNHHIEMLFTGWGMIERGIGEMDEFVIKGVAGFYRKVNRNQARRLLMTKEVYPLKESEVAGQKKSISSQFKKTRESQTYRMPEIISFSKVSI